MLKSFKDLLNLAAREVVALVPAAQPVVLVIAFRESEEGP